MSAREDQAATRDALLVRRLALVATIRELTSEMQRLNQMLAGAEMDVLRCELEIGRAEAGAQLVRDLHDAQDKAAAIARQRAACEERTLAAENDVDDLDHALAALADN